MDHLNKNYNDWNNLITVLCRLKQIYFIRRRLAKNFYLLTTNIEFFSRKRNSHGWKNQSVASQGRWQQNLLKQKTRLPWKNCFE